MLTYSCRLLYALGRGALAPPLPVTTVLATKFVAHPLDLDVNAHVNNAAYMRSAELARWQQCTQSRMLKAVLKNKWMFLVKDATINYHKPIPPFASYWVTVDSQHDGKKWFTIKQTFLSAPPGVEGGTATPPTVFAEMEITAVVKQLNGKTVAPTALVEASEAAIRKEVGERPS